MIHNLDLEVYRGVKIGDTFAAEVEGEQKARFTSPTQRKLTNIETQLQETYGHGLIYDLARRIQAGETLRGIEARLDVHRRIIRILLDVSGIPSLGRIESLKQKFADPNFKEADNARRRDQSKEPTFKEHKSAALKAAFSRPETKAVLSQKSTARWADREYKERVSVATSRGLRRKWDNDPEFAEQASARSAANFRRLWEDPNFLVQHIARTQAMWEDEDFRNRNATASRISLEQTRQQSDFKEKQIAGVRRKFEDSDYRSRHAEAARKNAVLPTIFGYRSDIDMFAKSAWEANIARVLQFMGRDFTQGFELPLTIPVEHQDLFKIGTASFTPDFIVVNVNGQIVAYEIMAHPLKDPITSTKLRITVAQYGPQMRISAITERFYRRLERIFSPAINADSRFSGWETGKDNLRTSPSKYGATSSTQ